MMRTVALLLLSIFTTFDFFAQDIVVNDSAQYGFNRPRIVLLGDTMPFITFGKAGAQSQLYGSKLVGGSFTQPIEVIPDSMSPRIGSSDGPNMVIHRDTMYIAWVNTTASNHHIYVSRSTDMGNTFDLPVRADSVFNGDNMEYPGIGIGPNGDIGVYYIRSTSSWTQPRHALVKSFDRAQTFGSEVVIDSFAPGQTCECCQGQLAINGNDWVYYFRNNVNDIRNNYTLYSNDGGQNFSGVYEMDSLDWFIQACPTSGPEGYINGNKSFSTWMTRGSGSMRILFGSVDLTSGAITKGDFVDNSIATGNTQNHPALAGRGDTLAIVWHDNRYLFTHVFARVSIDGGQTFGYTRLISDTSVAGSFSMGDVAFANGVFHFTWRSSSVVMYKAMPFNELVSVEENNLNENKIEVYPNPNHGSFWVQSDENISSIEVYNISGARVKTVQLKQAAKTEISLIDQPAGMYLLHVRTSKGMSIRKIIVN